jgi:hypothetical protein
MNFNDEQFEDCAMHGRLIKSVNSNNIICNRCNNNTPLIQWIEYENIKLCNCCCTEMGNIRRNRIKNNKQNEEKEKELTEQQIQTIINSRYDPYEGREHERPIIKLNYNEPTQVLMMQNMYNKSWADKLFKFIKK